MNFRLLIVTVSYILAIIYCVYYNLDLRISKLEHKGSVEAFLEPIVPEKTKFTKLNNIKMKIIMDSEDISCLAKNIYYEARNQGYIGKIAVAQTTFNRVKSGKWGDSICQVVYSPNQFSWTKEKQKRPYGSAWRASVDAARAFQHGVRVTTLDDSTFYHASYVKPKWASDMNKIAHIGEHIFYANK